MCLNYGAWITYPSCFDVVLCALYWPLESGAFPVSAFWDESWMVGRNEKQADAEEIIEIKFRLGLRGPCPSSVWAAVAPQLWRRM
jgi:hypothetical protein